jgi:hypothetical protein
MARFAWSQRQNLSSLPLGQEEPRPTSGPVEADFHRRGEARRSQWAVWMADVLVEKKSYASLPGRALEAGQQDRLG